MTGYDWVANLAQLRGELLPEPVQLPTLEDLSRRYVQLDDREVGDVSVWRVSRRS